jgi:PAS domain S-box-containing protein
MIAAPLIFVVDDDAGTLEVIGDYLRRGLPEARVEILASGAELMAHPMVEAADLFIVDIRLGDMDGRELVAQLPAACHYTPVLFISGHTMDDGEGFDRVQQLYVYDFISKPFHYLPLINRVGLLLRFKARQAGLLDERSDAEQGLVALFDIAPFLAVVLTEGLQIKYCNMQLAEFLGHPPAELIGRSWAEFLPLNQAELVATVHRRIMDPDDHEAVAYREHENLINRGDGRTHLVRWFNTPFEGPQSERLTLSIGVPLSYRYSRDKKQFRAYWLREVLSHKSLIRTLRARLEEDDRQPPAAACEVIE